jgi:hypothetical protein
LPESIHNACEYCRIDAETEEFFIETAEKIQADYTLELFSWHFYQVLCVYGENDMNFSSWPTLLPALGVKTGALYFIAALGVVSIIRERYRTAGIPEEIIRNTVLQFQGYSKNHIIGYGVPGLIMAQAMWLRNYIEMRLFRIGRLEYKFRKVSNLIEVYRNKNNNDVVSLVNTELNFDGEGYVTKNSDEVVWTSAPIRRQHDSFTGTLISPAGISLNREEKLRGDEWDVVLSDGGVVLDVHIPPGGGFAPDVVFDSMRRAIEFFDKYFPETETSMFFCISWIFNPELKKVLPDSNLSKVMKRLYLFPVDSDPDSGFFFVFYRDSGELENPPRETRMQRWMLDTLESGGRLRSGGMFILKDDVLRL